MYFYRQNFLVMGVSRSGVAAAEFLLDEKANVFLFDENTAFSDPVCAPLLERGAKWVEKDDLVKTAEDMYALVLSPGVPIDHPVPVAFKKKGKRILGESELAALFVKAVTLGVTGTNGKTTTVTMMGEVLKEWGKKYLLCGNIGTPYLSARSLSEEDFAVAEISSFQMETLSSFYPHIACVLNVTEDHLNRHYTMENYIFLKRKILKNLTESEYAVLNADDPVVAAFAEHTKANAVFFSLEREVDGAYLSGTELCYRGEKVMDIEELFVTGKHNVLNALAVIAMARILNIPADVIRNGLKKFKGVSHRIEQVDTVRGVTYINDSKATNADATIKAIESGKQEMILLLGGKDKGYEYAPLFEKIKRSYVVHTVLYGENRFKLLSAALSSGFEKVTLCEKFDYAFLLASLMAKEGQSVLLSPASASFDEFSSFEERGDAFRQKVKELKKEAESADTVQA